MFCKNRVGGRDCRLYDQFRMYGILKGADGLLLEDVAGEKEERCKYEDYVTILAVSGRLSRRHAIGLKLVPMPDDITTEICELVTSIFKAYINVPGEMRYAHMVTSRN